MHNHLSRCYLNNAPQCSFGYIPPVGWVERPVQFVEDVRFTLQKFVPRPSGMGYLKLVEITPHRHEELRPAGPHEGPLDRPYEGSAVRVPLQGTDDNSATNLAACIGECDSDDQCAPGLKCFQRSGIGPIPGCSGAGEWGWDYCYNPAGSIVLSGHNNNYATNLAACTHECDNDGQCAAGLRCFQRDGQETIPGCTGNGVSGWDYCFDPEWEPSIPSDTGYSYPELLRFPPITFPQGGEYTLCFCDAEASAKVDGRACERIEDYAVRVGTVHVSGVSCLLGHKHLARATCVPGYYGGQSNLRCYDGPAPHFSAPVEGHCVPDRSFLATPAR